MTATPTTTKLGPDQAFLNDLMRRLAEAESMAALENGQVDELIVDETADLDEDLRAELIRQASLTAARVEIVREHEGLRRHDGVAATLRYRR